MLNLPVVEPPARQITQWLWWRRRKLWFYLISTKLKG
ncbi:hypothetical protein SOVF_201660 [Spinacia oleracea]|nr:hypothetical protein SOVF_201660 [Spinacia oleracea]